MWNPTPTRMKRISSTDSTEFDGYFSANPFDPLRLFSKEFPCGIPHQRG